MGIVQTPAFHPVQPVNTNFHRPNFPMCQELSILHGIKHLIGYYSIEPDTSFCYPCHLSVVAQVVDLTSIGFKDWKHATDNKRTLNGHSALNKL